MRALEDKIVKILQEFKSIKAIHIAKKLRTTKKYINPILYSGKNDKYQIDSDYRWSLKKENVKEKKVDRNKTITYEKDLIKTETKSEIDSNKIGIKSLFNKYALVIPRPLIIELIKTQGVKINANEMMATQISHGKYLDIISVIEKNKSKGINNYLKKIKETQTQSHKNKSSDKPTKYIKRTLESPKMVKVYNKTIGEILYQFEIGVDVFKKELIELSHNLISNKVNIINNEGGIILTKKINNVEYQEIIYHLIKKGYKQFDKKKELRLKSVTTYGKKGVYTLKKDFTYERKNTTRDIIIEYLRQKQNPERIENIEAHVMGLNPYLKEKSTLGVINLNECYFKKYEGTGFIGLKSMNYSVNDPVILDKKTIDILKRTKSVNDIIKNYREIFYRTPVYQLKILISLYTSNLNFKSEDINIEEIEKVKKMYKENKFLAFIFFKEILKDKHLKFTKKELLKRYEEIINQT